MFAGVLTNSDYYGICPPSVRRSQDFPTSFRQSVNPFFLLPAHTSPQLLAAKDFLCVVVLPCRTLTDRRWPWMSTSSPSLWLPVSVEQQSRKQQSRQLFPFLSFVHSSFDPLLSSSDLFMIPFLSFVWSSSGSIFDSSAHLVTFSDGCIFQSKGNSVVGRLEIGLLTRSIGFHGQFWFSCIWGRRLSTSNLDSAWQSCQGTSL